MSCENGKHAYIISAKFDKKTFNFNLINFQNVEVKNRMAKVDVELWDTSGNSKFDNCWPALAREAHGVMFVFHPGKYISIILNCVLK